MRKIVIHFMSIIKICLESFTSLKSVRDDPNETANIFLNCQKINHLSQCWAKVQQTIMFIFVWSHIRWRWSKWNFGTFLLKISSFGLLHALCSSSIFQEAVGWWSITTWSFGSPQSSKCPTEIWSWSANIEYI